MTKKVLNNHGDDDDAICSEIIAAVAGDDF